MPSAVSATRTPRSSVSGIEAGETATCSYNSAPSRAFRRLNLSAIFSKTGKGVQEASGKTSNLSRGDRAVLSAIDGKTALLEVQKKFDTLPGPKFQALIQQFDKDGYIRQVSPGSQPAAPVAKAPPPKAAPADEGEGLDFTQATKLPPKAPAAPEPPRVDLAAAEAKVKAARDAAIRMATEAKAKAEADARARTAAAERDRQAAAEREREADERARKEAEDKARLEAALNARLEAERKAREDAERRAAEAAERARKELEEKMKREAEELRQRFEIEMKAKLEEERKAREEEDRKRREQEDRRREEEEEARAREDVKRRAREEAERKKREEEERKRREEDERRRREEDERRAQEEAERRAREEADRKKREEEERKRREEEEHNARQEAERKAKEAAAREAKEEAERRAKDDAERRAKKEAEKRRRDEEEQRAQEEAERKLREEDERRKDEKAERKRKTKESLAARQAEERAAKAAARKGAGKAAGDASAGDEELDMDEIRGDQKALAARAAALEREQPPVTAAAGRPKKWGKPAAIALFVLLGAGVGLLHVMPVSTAEYEKAASEAMGVPVKIGSARLSVIAGIEIGFEGISIGDAVKIRQARGFPELGSLFGAKKAFSRIELEGVSLSQAQVAAAVLGKVAGENFRVGRVLIRQLVLQGPLKLPPLDVEATLSGDGSLQSVKLSGGDKLVVRLSPKGGEVAFEISAGSLALPFVPALSLADFGMKGTASRAGVTASEFDGRAFDGVFSGTARIRWNAHWSAEGEVRVRGVNVAVFAPALVSEGRVEGRGAYAMSGNSPAVLHEGARLQGDFKVDKGVLGNFDLTRALESGGARSTGRTVFNELTGQGVYDKGAVQLRNIAIVAGAMNAGASVDIDAGGGISGRITADVKMPTQTLRAVLNISGKVQDPVIRK